MNLKIYLAVIISLLIIPSSLLQAQGNQGTFSGNLETNGRIFLRDTLIGAAETPQFDHQFWGAEAWINLNYSNWGFDFNVRFDFFHNSNLLNRQGSYTAQGIGRWYVRKQMEKFSAAVGYIYDQIGTGVIFRSYEQRALGIDNALYGVQLGWDFNEDWRIRAFSGLQKQQFDTYNSVLTGMYLEGFIVGDEDSKWSIAPGLGFVGRTLDNQSMNSLVSTLNTYLKDDAFVPVYNSYGFSLYNSLTWGPINWYFEAAYKTDDNLIDPMGVRNSLNSDGDTIVIEGPRYFKAPGSVLYTSLGFVKGGLGITLEGKRTENFSFRTIPQATLFQGLVNFLPPMTRTNTYRLNARYNAATQELGEWALQADIRYRVNRELSFTLNFANLTDLNNQLLYRELYFQTTYNKPRKWTLNTGVQFQNYNQEVYEVKPDAPIVEAFTPYVDYVYRLDRRKSIKFRAQYMLTGEDKGLKHDYGDWVFGLLEFSMAPRWTFTVSDMYNIQPGKQSPIDGETGERVRIHYPRFDVFYTFEASRFSLSYVKQVEGIVCTGGICRLEPAFSGVQLSVLSTF